MFRPKLEALCTKWLLRLLSDQPWALLGRHWIKNAGAAGIWGERIQWQDLSYQEQSHEVGQSEILSDLVRIWKNYTLDTCWIPGSLSIRNCSLLSSTWSHGLMRTTASSYLTISRWPRSSTTRAFNFGWIFWKLSVILVLVSIGGVYLTDREARFLEGVFTE